MDDPSELDEEGCTSTLCSSLYMTTKCSSMGFAAAPGAGVQSHFLYSSKTTSRVTCTLFVAGSNTLYALAPSASPMKIIGVERSASLSMPGPTRLTWATHPNVRR